MATTPPKPRRQRLARSLGPARPALKRVHDGIFAGALPRLAARRLRRSGAPELALAVDGIRGDGLSPQEADWVRRIEARRDELAARPGQIEFDRPYLDPPPEHRDLPFTHIARVSSIHRPWGTFLLRLVRELRPLSCLELGTAAGISGSYIAAGLELNGAGRLITVDGSANLAAIARESFAGLGLSRTEVRVGAFDQVLDEIVAEAAPLEFAYVDAGKTRKAMFAQLDALAPHLAAGGVVVFDDIHWSREMAGTWRRFRRDPHFELATDLWRVGMLRRRTAAA